MLDNRGRPVRIGAWRCASFGATQALLLILVLFPLLPGHLHVNVGDIASQTITAPRSFSFSSDVVRRQLQDQAAGGVKDVITYDVNVAPAQLAILNQSLASGELDRGLSPDQANAAGTEARRVLGDVLQEPFTADDLTAKRASIPARISQALSVDQRAAIAAAVRPLVQSTEKVDSAATDAQRQRAIAAVPPQIRRFAANQDIVRQGEPIDASDLEALRAAGLLDARLPLSDLVAVSLIAIATALALSLYVLVFQPATLATNRRLLLLAIVNALILLLAKLYFPFVLSESHRHLFAFALPVAIAPMLIASLFEAQIALLTVAVVSLLAGFAAIYVPQLSGFVGLTALQLFQLILTFMLSGLAGVYWLRGTDRFSRYLLAAAGVSGAAFLGVMTVWWLDPTRNAVDLLWIALACGISGALAAVVTVGATVLVGPLFGITTRLQLMELGQLNAPLLRRLQEEAPGTFHHSVLVGNLAERAADLVGADPLLVRVGCYYHDIGKMSRPGYFIENQFSGVSPHSQLAPASSAEIIAEHVRYGRELARRYGLPDALAAFISEHHGTRMVSYFYRKAAQDDPEVDTGPFSYPGPRPQSRETGIVMLADSTEAAVRAAADRSREQIDSTVDAVINERVAEGQLDESDLTLRDLRTIAESFKVTLRAIYHPRIEYPAPTPLEEARRRHPSARRIGAGE